MTFAKDGHYCRSLYEYVIDNWLPVNGIEHEVEPHYPQDVDLNSRGLRRPDWRLPNGTLVECAGLAGDSAYEANLDLKRRLAEKYRIRLLVLLQEDLKDLGAVFGTHLADQHPVDDEP